MCLGRSNTFKRCLGRQFGLSQVDSSRFFAFSLVSPSFLSPLLLPPSSHPLELILSFLFTLIRFALENGCHLYTYICATAAAGGHLDCLEYAYMHGCKLERYIIPLSLPSSSPLLSSPHPHLPHSCSQRWTPKLLRLQILLYKHDSSTLRLSWLFWSIYHLSFIPLPSLILLFYSSRDPSYSLLISLYCFSPFFFFFLSSCRYAVENGCSQMYDRGNTRP